ncbi:ribosome biogenesis protein LTV1 [Kluyveromyces lactis]|uniref:KLLA0E13729p n=1 Tax=Kluyveromyces lactis (strain ATCC 8585 / CBS 2359 / DSM 70799 / NBRC 1267 / NRRL Y-1140 / WM37) TaxID=284590 RepID=Q6CNC0_KLULA|nr:uncharacterized protein KLLA0_E13729g [Kluyveromyces lactis]CAG99656.1 KLLA0E13729p [Kluyveromyces lactis]|eukprot:XP_454569.1 uncharacterized protein KLLA0_E13729g [Kluyveromyces lactis]
MSGRTRFNKNNATKFAVVHRPHDDPNYHDPEAGEHVLVPVQNRHKKKDVSQSSEDGPIPKLVSTPTAPSTSASKNAVNEHVGEAALYGITFDDSKYDYTQHLKPIGLDPSHSVFIPAKSKKPIEKKKLKDPESLFVEPSYQDLENKAAEPLFVRGVAKQEYLDQMQEIPGELVGFKPDMNPALREVLVALEDDAYVINEDVAVEIKPKSNNAAEGLDEDDDDIFAELLGSGKADGADEFEDEFDEWDMQDLDNFEEEHYKQEMAQFDDIGKLQDLQGIDVSADVRRFKLQQKKVRNDWDSENDFSDDDNGSINHSEDEEELKEEVEDGDVLGSLPSFKTSSKTGGKARKARHKKGAMSDVSGFSMSSSALARTEVMTVLDDKYDQIIGGYENYEEELAEDEEKHESFDMLKERPDLESMLDDFLDNYELGSGNRKLVKKDEEIARLKEAADEVSKGKLSMRRKREKEKKSVKGITNGLNSLKF